MQKLVKIIFWTSFLCVGCFFVIWSVCSIWLDRPSVILEISPERVEFQTKFPAGTVFQAELTLANRTRTDLVIKRIMSSCGSTGLFTKEGKLVEVPMVLTRFESLPVLVSVDTKNMEGKESVSVMVFYEHREKSLFSAGNVFFEVAPKSDAEVSE